MSLGENKPDKEQEIEYEKNDWDEYILRTLRPGYAPDEEVHNEDDKNEEEKDDGADSQHSSVDSQKSNDTESKSDEDTESDNTSEGSLEDYGGDEDMESLFGPENPDDDDE